MENMENLIRELVTLADTMNTTAVHLVASDNADALEIITRHLGPITDSTIDDLIEFMDDDNDDWNE